MNAFVQVFIVVHSQQHCANDLSNYLVCIKGELDRNYIGYETELRDDFKRLARNCFAGTIQ